MKISLEQVVPIPLDGLLDDQSNIWGADVHIDSQYRYKVFAPSGRGKSTFVHCVYGLRDDYKGQVKIDDVDIRSFSSNQIADLRKSNISVIFQDLRLFLNLTARENLLLKSSLYGEDELTEEVIEMTHFLGVNRLLEKPAKHLSYGERQRFAIIRALIPTFDFLMMDEPFSHLDEDNISKACELISQKCKKNKAGFLIVSLGYDYEFDYDKTLHL